jgi:hypothetical protein
MMDARAVRAGMACCILPQLQRPSATALYPGRSSSAAIFHQHSARYEVLWVVSFWPYLTLHTGTFSHHGDSDLHRLYQADFAKWAQLVNVIRHTTAWLCQSKGEPSFYFLSLLNPFNVLPLRWSVACFGISADFWRDIIVPIYSSSFLTTELTYIPSVIVPSKRRDAVDVARMHIQYRAMPCYLVIHV